MAAKRQGAWELRVPPGPHSLKLTADGMRDEERQIAVDVKHNLKQTITMTTAQRFATMVIKDGTPGAQVLIDQQFVGALDANGSLTYSKVPAGHHDISFEKVGYSSLSTRQLFFENRTLPVPGNLRLSEATGHVTISISPSTAKVEYRQAGTANWQTIPSRVISLPPGNYDFAATAPQFQRAQRSVAVKVSETSPLNFALQPETPPPPTANSLISGSASLVSSNGWFISKTGAWIAVPSGTMECTIIFLRPDRYPAGDRPPKHLQWVIATDQDTISYALDSHGLSRKATTAGGPKKIPANFPSDLNYDVRLTVSQNTIQLKSKDGLLLDELKTDAENWTHVEVRVKGDAYFDVRR
jgi:hypothetical protein